MDKIDIFSCDIKMVERILKAIEDNKGQVNPPTSKDCEPHYFFPLNVKK